MTMVDVEGVSGLMPLLEARSIAVIGASSRPATVGHHLIRQLVGGGFEGTVHPVNPRYEQIEGLPVAPRISDLPPVDLAVIAVANAALVTEFETAVAAGARSLAVFASCHGVTDGGEPIVDRLAAIASRAGVPVCGGNGMGFLNLDQRLRVCGFHQPWDLQAGGITFLTHSGSLFSAMLHNRRHLRFNLVVSSGNELATTMAAYLDYAATLESTRVVGMFLETVRDPTTMAAALERAANRDLPVVALKAGRTERGRSAVATHSAALAGDHAAFEAFARGHGVHLVDTMEEFADTLAVFDGGARSAPGALGAVHDSGGERTMLIDTAERIGIPLAQIGDDTRARLAATLDPGLEPDNPVDAWGTGRDAGDVLANCSLALAADPSVGSVVVSLDLTSEDNPDEGYGPTLVTIARQSMKPVAVLSNVPDAVDPGEAKLLADAGVPVLRGLESGLRAMGHFMNHPLPRPRAHPPHPAAEAWVRRLASGKPLLDAEALWMLGDFGIPAIEAVEVASEEDAVEAADRIGHPVTLKATGLLHRSDVDGVHLNLTDGAAVGSAYRAVAATLGTKVLLQPMAAPGVEMTLGMFHDPQFGPIVLVGAGGVLIEVLHDTAASIPRLDASAAERLVDRLAMRPVLDGVRGRPRADMSALIQTVVAFSRMVSSLDGVIESVDVNPLIVGPLGAIAVDAVIVPRGG